MSLILCGPPDNISSTVVCAKKALWTKYHTVVFSSTYISLYQYSYDVVFSFFDLCVVLNKTDQNNKLQAFANKLRANPGDNS